MNTYKFNKIGDLRSAVDDWMKDYVNSGECLERYMQDSRDCICVTTLNKISNRSCGDAPTWCKELLRMYT